MIKTKNQSAFVLTLILGSLMTVSPFTIDMYLPAFGQIAAEFATTVPRVSLSLSSYFVGLAVGQLLYGPCLDRFGRKPPLYFGLSLYVLATLACTLSHNVETLIVYRFFQALGGCVASVACIAMVRDFYTPQESGRVLSRLMLILSVSPLFAPTVGSLVSTEWGWRAVFVFLAVIVGLILICTKFFLPHGKPADATVSLKIGPVVSNYLEIFKHHMFLGYALAGAFSFSSLFIYLSGSPALFMGTFGFSEREFGLIFALLSVGIIGGSQVNIFLTRKFSGRSIFRTAQMVHVLIATLYLVSAAFNWFGTNPYPHIFMIFLILACLGLTYPNAVAQAVAPFERNSGSASALLGFLQMAIGALGAAIFSQLTFASAVSMGILFVCSATIGFGISHVYGKGD